MDEDSLEVDEEGRPLIRGRHLRYLLVLILDRTRVEMTPSQLEQAVRLAGFGVVGPPGKSASDALRWAVRHGHARRNGHGRYATSHGVTKQLRHRYRARIAALRPAAR